MTEDLIQRMVAALVEAAKPARVVLFGSRARGDARENSDVECLAPVFQAAAWKWAQDSSAACSTAFMCREQLCATDESPPASQEQPRVSVPRRPRVHLPVEESDASLDATDNVVWGSAAVAADRGGSSARLS